MRSSVADAELDVRPTDVRVTDSTLTVELEDGRTISVPTAWYPRLRHATAKERANCKLGAFGISWPVLDEDVSVRGLLLGRKSGESAGSFKFWLETGAKGRLSR